MEEFKTIESLQQRVRELKQDGKTIGFVPTLGALHEGHATLIRKSKRNNDITVCSIYVNPTQFNIKKDLEKYPRTLKTDRELLLSLECDILFLPNDSEIYPEGIDLTVDMDFGNMFNIMEGEFRPGHFDGVVTVVNRFLDIVKPHNLYMGQKDFQQSTLIKIMIEKLNLPVKLDICKTKREGNGLAMSSRNLRLSEDLKSSASIIYKTLKAVKRNFDTRSINELKDYAFRRMKIPDFRPEYFEIINGHTLEPIDAEYKSDYIVACTAVWAGEIRLIDNLILKKPKKKKPSPA